MLNYILSESLKGYDMTGFKSEENVFKYSLSLACVD